MLSNQIANTDPKLQAELSERDVRAQLFGGASHFDLGLEPTGSTFTFVGPERVRELAKKYSNCQK